MKIGIFNSTLSCIKKCIIFFVIVIFKALTLGLLMFIFLGACASPTAMLGPAYTLSSTGNVLQAGFSYGSNQMITAYTGKTPIENLQEIAPIKKNIKKQTLESEDFYILLKSRIDKTSDILKLSSQ